jgi:hypothetical protein
LCRVRLIERFIERICLPTERFRPLTEGIDLLAEGFGLLSGCLRPDLAKVRAELAKLRADLASLCPATGVAFPVRGDRRSIQRRNRVRVDLPLVSEPSARRFSALILSMALSRADLPAILAAAIVPATPAMPTAPVMATEATVAQSTDCHPASAAAVAGETGQSLTGRLRCWATRTHHAPRDGRPGGVAGGS